MLSLSSQITPEHLFYIRNHFPYPAVDLSSWKLQLGGMVDRPAYYGYDDLLRMPQHSLSVTLQCAGERRAYFHPRTPGEQWELGANSHAVWTGVRLADLLHTAGISSKALEVTFEGMDRGVRTDMPGEYAFTRSLPVEVAHHPDILIALYMNGHPLPFRHGFPARLIVPGWYGMASVKWLHRMTVIDEPFQGPFQTIDYVYDRNSAGLSPSEPVTSIRLHAIIAQPLDQGVVACGKHWITGVAMSGDHPVAFVEVSTDEGGTWQAASWIDAYEPYAWRRWCYPWEAAGRGTYFIMARATDVTGNTQPLAPDWNKKGYGYNAIQKIQIHVE